ncbi:MAG: hypothetical protein JW876_00640 [Candidatus Krumholzibacteriota bacterium]|nr:hypothetical protein [Candidatus Krumholzibacteriota bacterium]
MKTVVELWVRLKVVDLVAGTAWMTLTEKLDFGDSLRGLVRYSYWRMEAEGASAGAVVDAIDRAVRLDSAFTNQNKHLYRLRETGGAGAGDLAVEEDYPVRATGGGELRAVDLLVREKRPESEAAYAARLGERLEDVRILSMTAGEVWRIIVSAADDAAAVGLAERMAVTRSRREGLLLNPHYQRHEIVAVGPVVRKEGDR